MGRRVLITGAAGMLGQDLVRACEQRGQDVVALSHSELDITDAAQVHAALSDAAAAVVVNCAAFTDVDAAERDCGTALAVNGAGAGHVARAAEACGAWTIHVSSDYVFDGSKREPYVESDATRPLSAYGRSKLDGEQAVAAASPKRSTIVRSSWLFGAGGPCFPATILRLAAGRDHLDVVDDQVGSPTFTGHLAAALAELTREPPPAGIVHLAGAGACSWFEFATEIVDAAGVACEVRPVPTTQMPRPATRPAYSVLGTERAEKLPRLPHWRAGLAEYLTARVRA